MKPCLIVYYSRSGVTGRLAQALARACDADLEAIEDVRPRHGAAGYARSAWEALRGTPAPVAPPRHHPADYPLVVLGTPVWAGHMSSPMRGYLLQQRVHLRRIALFCTMGGSGGAGVLTAMADLCNQLPVATLCVRQRDVLAERCGAPLADFARALAQAQRELAEVAPAGAPPA